MSESKKVVVVGAGVGGLSAGLALSRAGHQVVVVERDATPMPERIEDAFAWERQGAPQFHHSHAFMPRLRQILRDQFPDVYDSLIANGVPDKPSGAEAFGLPEGYPGSEDIVLLPCRRTTYEWVLRTAILAEPTVELRVGVAVDGVIADNAADTGAVPTVTGIRLSDGEIIDADVVVATTGRRGDVPGWLAQIGVDVPETIEEAGITYLSRFFQVRPDQTAPDLGYLAARRGGVTYSGFESDNRTFSVTLVIDPTDSEMRRHLSDDKRFDATCALMPEIADLVSPTLADAVTPVHVMAGIINRLRTFTDPTGQPTVAGFFALGDAYMVTNPIYARGCTVSMIQAVALADALASHPDDPIAQAIDYEAVAALEVTPWYHLSVLLDQVTASSDDGGDFGASAGGFVRMLTDPEVALGFARVFSMLDPPQHLSTNPALMDIFTTGFSDMPNAPTENQLTRDDILAVAKTIPTGKLAESAR